MGKTVNWLILISNIAFTLIAAFLGVLGLNTLKTIKHLNTGKSFWIPIIASSLLFSISSITAIFNEVGFSSTIANEIGQITQLTALCFLSGAIYSYSKLIKRNLSAKYIIFPETTSTKDAEMEAPPADKRALPSDMLRIEAVSGCDHQLGYLRTLPIHASLPEECLSCDKIIECKHS